MKKAKIVLLSLMSVFSLLFIVSLFNPLRNDDVRSFEVEDNFIIRMEERENLYDEEYLLIEITNTSKETLYNVEMVFGYRDDVDIRDRNYIWFRIPRIEKDDVINIKQYELLNTSELTNKKEDYTTYDIVKHVETGEFDLEKCMRVELVNIDSESPKVHLLRQKYWSMEKTIFLVLAVGFGVAFVYVHTLSKKEEVK